MQVVLLRVGIDTGKDSGGTLGPLFRDGSFEFVPILDGHGLDERTYGSIIGRHGKPLIEYFPKTRQHTMRNHSAHVDPEFNTFTYGDPTRPKRGLRRLRKGDLLVFYSGLAGWDFKSEPALYIVGYFDVLAAGIATQFTESALQQLFAGNFHVRHKQLFAEQRERLVLIKGSENSRLLSKAVRVSERGRDSAGQPMYILSQEMKKKFGEFAGAGSIQRSNPRWVHPTIAPQAAEFVTSLGFD
jgi:Nucleotide modification associated domain 3